MQKLRLLSISEDLHLYEDRVVLSITAVMDTTQSWLHPESIGNKKLIAHEQLHFAISELWARKLRQSLQEEVYPKTDYQRLVYKKHLAVKAAWEAMQKRYDRETKHGTNGAVQIRWREQIEKELVNLSDFESIEIRLWLK